LNKMHKS